jgi:methylase of polypeptide subunit release factors
MIKAYAVIPKNKDANTTIVTGSFIKCKATRPKVDMIITSPPYVTSYEYADLHQLSSLWLNYTDDYRSLRKGSIGSLYHDSNAEIEKKSISKTGFQVVSKLEKKDKRQSKSVAKYFYDMQEVVKKCSEMLRNSGFLVMVIGDTEYKGVHIENARHVVELLLNNDFVDVEITKRKVSGKILTPYRDSTGRFSAEETSKKVYSEEFIIAARKK